MQPLIGSYIHHNKESAALIVLNLDTDFAARTKEAIDAANKLALYAVGFDCDSVEKLLNHEYVGELSKDIIKILKEQLKENIQLVKVVLVKGRE